jgi:hypothetical protein
MAHALTDHETIRRWAEARGVRPAAVIDPDHPDDDGLEIRLTPPGEDFDEADESLTPVTWAEWFRRFDQHELALLIEDAARQPSTFNKLVRRSSLR